MAVTPTMESLNVSTCYSADGHWMCGTFVSAPWPWLGPRGSAHSKCSRDSAWVTTDGRRSGPEAIDGPDTFLSGRRTGPEAIDGPIRSLGRRTGPEVIDGPTDRIESAELVLK